MKEDLIELLVSLNTTTWNIIYNSVKLLGTEWLPDIDALREPLTMVFTLETVERTVLRTIGDSDDVENLYDLYRHLGDLIYKVAVISFSLDDLKKPLVFDEAVRLVMEQTTEADPVLEQTQALGQQANAVRLAVRGILDELMGKGWDKAEWYED